MKIFNALAPLVKLVVKQVFLTFVFPELKKADPKAYETVLVSLYGPIDVYVEALVEKTGTEFDNAGVEAIMEAIEESAAADNIELPNLDED